MVLEKEIIKKLSMTSISNTNLESSQSPSIGNAPYQTPMSQPPSFKFPDPSIPSKGNLRNATLKRVGESMTISAAPSNIPTNEKSCTPSSQINMIQQQTQQKKPLEEPEHDYLKLILNARVYDVAIESPLTLATKLSSRLNNKIYLKREDLQPIFSFKCRGAYNRMYRLSPEEKKRGVIAVSAGNHAQGVALAAQKLGIKATIVMPSFAPEIKVDNVRRLGSEIVLTGGDLHEARTECARLAEENQYTFIPPFDDPYIIAGQGTVGVEILRQLKQDHLDAIFVCCGGGGLLAGIAAYVKRIRPEVKVIGVNTEDSDSMFKSLQKGERVELAECGLFADGTAVRLVGSETFRLCRDLVDDFVLATNDEICAAIKDTFEDTRSILEPAGALALAGCKKYLANNPQMKDGVFVCVLSGANMNFDRLRFVAERAKLGDNREAMLSVIIPERPGSFLELYSIISPRFVVEFSYRYSDPQKAHIYIAFEVTKGREEIDAVMEELKSKGIDALDITDNEMAKTHARYLAGGRSSTVSNEVIYRFRFAERPGALRKFLEHIEGHPRWNVSLWHYRNHGADIGRMLVGFQVPANEREDFQKFIAQTGYPFVDETDNPVYAHFLK